MASQVTTKSEFNQSYLDLQKEFCCSDDKKAKLLKWLGCTPGIYQGSKTIFTAADMALCSWFQEIYSYALETVVIPGETVQEVEVDADFLMIKATYKDGVLEDERVFELGINKQEGRVGMTIPFPIGPGPANPVDYIYLVIKDLYIMNGASEIGPSIKINNITTNSLTVGIFAAKK